MRFHLKIICKVIVLILFFLYTPFFDGLRELIKNSHFLDLLVVKQATTTEEFSLKKQLNVFSIPSQATDDKVIEETISTANTPISNTRSSVHRQTRKKYTFMIRIKAKNIWMAKRY